MLLAGLQVLIHISWLARGLHFIISRVTLDDTYYYVQTAWNTSIYGFPTFDGINATNGVQFLWFWLLVALAHVVPTKQSLLFLALILCLLCNLSGYIAIWCISKRQSLVMTLIMMCSWFYLVARYSYYMTGMENSIHALFFWMLLVQLIALEEDLYNGRDIRRRFVLVTVLSILSVWVRLDSVIYVVPLYLYIEWRLLRKGIAAQALKLTLVVTPFILSSAGLIFWSYYQMGGSFIPVSGLVKGNQLGLNKEIFIWIMRSILRGFRLTFPLEVWRLFIRQPDGFFPPLEGERVIGPLTLGLFILTFFLVNQHYRPKVIDDNGRGMTTASVRFPGVYIILWIASVVYILYYSSGGIHSTYAVWYLSPFFISCIIAGASGMERMMNISLFRRPTLWTGVIGALWVSCLGLILATNYYLLGTPYQSGEQYTRVEVAQWMRDCTEPEAIFAAWNAGGFGFLSDRRVINLDGLINSNEYYQYVLKAQKTSPALYIQRLLSYLDQQNVAYVVDNNVAIPAALKKSYVLVTTFPIRGEISGGSIEVYKNPHIDVAERCR